jgi:outer membrane receptor protein involved in Fe transport
VGGMYPLGDNSISSAAKQTDYTIVDLLLEYTLPIKKFKTKVYAGVDNFFETEYNFLVTDYGWGSDYYGYYPAPERTYKAGLGVKF